MDRELAAMPLKRYPLPAEVDPPPREVTVAATQMALSWDIEDNLAKAERVVRKAAAQGAQSILLQVRPDQEASTRATPP